uniref:Uncharacterized protein n=1 Tax=viral metagenome TaxID=1070528 RepID=A0A6M3IMR6_9ZZZZ
MKNLIVLAAIISLLVITGQAGADYMVIHAPEQSKWEMNSIDPGFNPNWSGYQRVHTIFKTLDEVFEYLNSRTVWGGFYGVKVYEIKEVPIKKHQKTQKEEIERVTDEQWTREGDKPQWQEESKVGWVKSGVTGF